MISGLGQACLEYNLEVRMYALAFLCVMGCFYCSYRVIADGTRKTWTGMVLWALGAAYSHYYALVAVGIMMFSPEWQCGSNTAVRPGEKVYWQSWHF